jgi:hypothetical protein
VKWTGVRTWIDNRLGLIECMRIIAEFFGRSSLTWVDLTTLEDYWLRAMLIG